MKWQGMVLYLILICDTLVTSQNTDSFYDQRRNMVATQIQARGISDINVQKAMEKVPRHLFVLPEHISYAYQDTPLPISDGQTI